MKKQHANVMTLHLEIGKGSQSVIFKELIDLNGYKLRVTIKRDSYDDQSFARIELFAQSSGSWNALADIYYSNMNTPKGLHHRDDHIENSLYARDRMVLINQANAILHS